MTNSSELPHEHLYDVPIEQLELSDLQSLKRTGITTIGDCVDFYVRGADAMIQAPWPLIPVMDGEVQEKMKAHGYWSYVESE